MPIKKVTYFNGRGRAEVIRLVLSATNEKFDDERFSHEQWGAVKPKFKFGLLPVLTLESGDQMNESMAIARFLARKAKIYGKDEWEMYLIDRAIDTMNDLHLKWALSFFEKDEKKKEEMLKDVKDKFIPQYLGNLTKYAEEAKGDFIAGSSASLADIVLLSLLENFKDSRPNYPKLDNIYKKSLEAFPGIKKYLETRPETPF